MKKIKKTSNPSKLMTLIILLVLTFFNGNAQIDDKKRSEHIKPDTNIEEDLFWQVKAFRPEAELLKVKAVDKDGNIYDVKAIQYSGGTSSVLSVKAIVSGKRLSVKIILPTGNDKYFPLVAIDENGKLLKIVAINDNGKFIEIKGHCKSGNIIHISAIKEDNMGYNILAISPYGEVNSVVGMKMLDTTEEAVINGVSVYAHVKAIKQN